MLKNTKNSYGYVAKIFHWLLAIMIFVMLGFGLYMTSLPDEAADKPFYYGMHKASGVIVLLLVLLRLTWRGSNQVPALPSDLPAWQSFAARSNHYVLYGLMILMPLSGIMMSILGGHSISLYGLYTIPALAKGPNLFASLAHDIHLSLVYFWFIFIGLHISAAMYHHFWRRDDILRRMLP